MKAPMEDHSPDIVVLTGRIDRAELARLTARFFGDMVKYVVDIRRGIIALGGELHADAKEVLLAAGSRQEDLWGANYWPGRGRDGCLEYTSLINVSPGRGNRGMEIADEEVRARVRELSFALIGEGEEIGG
jgi:hypothetical protein